MTPHAPVSVLIVEDDVLAQRALRRYLDEFGFRVVGACATGEDGVATARELLPDVVLMDVRLPVMDGVTAAEQIHSALPDTVVLMVTSFDDDTLIDRATGAGASGYLLKTTTPAALAAAIHAAREGLHVFAPEHMQRRRRTILDRRAPHLSQREEATLHGVIGGQTNAEIGAELYLSESTVKGVVRALMAKLDAESRVHLVARAHELGLVRR